VARDRASRPQAKAIRLFVAVEVSSEAKRTVASAIGPWRDEFPRARWVPEENWHVTVKFLGWTYPRLVGWTIETVGSVASRNGPIGSCLTGLGAFPTPGRARVLWAGLDDAAGRMATLAEDLDRSLIREFKAEGRAFRPHLTLARSDPPLRLSSSFGETPLEPVAFAIDRVVVFRSHLQRPAPRYEPLEAFPLDG
jgi:2'-5' RNA ligase